MKKFLLDIFELLYWTIAAIRLKIKEVTERIKNAKSKNRNN